jgi:hypothetical protein
MCLASMAEDTVGGVSLTLAALLAAAALAIGLTLGMVLGGTVRRRVRA